MLQKVIIVQLLENFASKKGLMELGYPLAVTGLERIGEGKVREHTGDVLFPVEFSCITFKMSRGEILEGVVHNILRHGVLLRCDPVNLSHQMMSEYTYVPGENPIFMNEKMSRIEKRTVVRFMVLGTKYNEDEKELKAVVSLEGTNVLALEQNSGLTFKRAIDASLCLLLPQDMGKIWITPYHAFAFVAVSDSCHP
ncbi:hypothetical protein K7X08_010398 [Anisodus acutangulus]|uniref:DNA-directed RNA polymerase subunit n=1 Tax=Anisodus acutangulus TaxID=402998 RepID=A0A9Q1N125_9SOLA|nr:hypothetical protein K7X08_010398 [Anisodus acutangulus]